jgi:hypothetical protein
MNPLQPEARQFLSEGQIEALLTKHPRFRRFWETPSPLLIVRGRPSQQDPVYEIQLVWDLEDRLETYCWLWIDALKGEILRQFPE